MLKVLNSTDNDFALKLAETLDFSSGGEEVVKSVAEILRDVKNTGDQALNFYTRKFDNADHEDGDFKVSKDEIEAAFRACDGQSIDALEAVKKRIIDYHSRQLPEDKAYIDADGVKLGWKWTAVESAGIYVPGGLASYPSSVLMNALPAKVAGVKRIAMVVPAPKGKLNPLVLAAAKIAGIDEVYKLGGAQAVGALAYGTASVVPVVKIVGPGNSFVAEAKRQVFGVVGIDSIAGPSEILVIADDKANPDWIAADLLSQAEHSADARSVLITPSAELAKRVGESLVKFLPSLKRKEIAGHSFRDNGMIIIARDLQEACDIANRIAPEHLELMVKDAEKLADQITNAGAIFLGNYTCESIGDYSAGPSHVLPTGSSAKFSSGLSVYDFLKRSSLIGVDEAAFKKLAGITQKLAEEEGLDAHAMAVLVRMK